jgi:hypothetical protein
VNLEHSYARASGLSTLRKRGELMTKVRDLGINAIPVDPAVMRPPEIGPDGAVVVPMIACPDSTCMAMSAWKCTEVSPALQADDRPQAPGFTPDAIVQLKQQLQERIGKQLVN